MRKTPVQALPNARRTFAALREIGYDFNSAVSDIVDNSISARAKTVAISFRREEGKFFLSIEDDGLGMSRKKLLEALRLGSETEYESDSLGKYGMGLKTASLSQCTSITVVSHSKRDQLCGYMLDLAHINRRNEWELLALDDRDLGKSPLFEKIKASRGTVVIWDNLDRLGAEYSSFQRKGAADNWFGRVLTDLQLHLRMTFHRFLDGSTESGQKVRINFNDTRLAPWDPFCRSEPNTTPLKRYTFTVLEGETPVQVRIEPYVLPVKDGDFGFSSIQAWQDAAGMLPWNDSQGYYVYRRDRLIHCGGWLRTRAKDEHTKYARVGIYFDGDADELFALSVNKAQIKLPASLFEYLKQHVNADVIKAAQKPYRTAARGGDTGKRHAGINKSISKKAPGLMHKHGIHVKGSDSGEVHVANPKGGFLANTDKEAFPFRLKAKFSVQTGVVEDGQLWKVVCKADGGFHVILNCDHPFYEATYEKGDLNPSMVAFLDSLLFALAYAELKNANTVSRPLFNEIRDTISEVLRNISEETS